MTLQSSGILTLQDVNRELERASPYNQAISLNDLVVRQLARVAATGSYSMSALYGKTYKTPMSPITISSQDYWSILVASGGKSPTYSPQAWRYGTALIGHPRWPDQIYRNYDEVTIYTLPVGAWFTGGVLSIFNDNPLSQKINLSAAGFCGIWDTCNMHMFRTSPSQVEIGAVNSGHVPDYSISNFNLNTTDIIPPFTTYQYNVYMDSSYNGDYKYNLYAGGLYSMSASFNSWV